MWFWEQRGANEEQRGGAAAAALCVEPQAPHLQVSCAVSSCGELHAPTPLYNSEQVLITLMHAPIPIT